MPATTAQKISRFSRFISCSRKNHMCCMLMTLAILLSTTACTTYAESTNKTDSYPLNPLKIEQRLLSFEKYISTSDFNVSRFQNDTDKKTCEESLEKLKENYSINIVEPSKIYWNKKQNQEISEFNACGQDFDFYNDYYPLIDHFPTKEVWRKLPNSYVIRHNFIELYDISNIFGPGFYATHLEGGIIDCNSSKFSLCQNKTGFSENFKILNAQNCNVHANVTLPVSRMGTSVQLNETEKTVTHHETLNFTSFFKTKNKFQVLKFLTAGLPNKDCKDLNRLSCSSNQGKLFLLEYYEKNQKPSGHMCVYELNQTKE